MRFCMNATFDRARTSTNVVIGLVGAVPSGMCSDANRTNCRAVGGRRQTGIFLVEARLRPSQPVVLRCSTNSGSRPRFHGRISWPRPPRGYSVLSLRDVGNAPPASTRPSVCGERFDWLPQRGWRS
jgi:hypothetical protein